MYILRDLKIPNKRFRPELEGIRAVAALLVAVYHIWIGSVSGGVDVFFIVSGYLITLSLISRIEREGRINFSENLLGLARRLLPLASTVILISAIMSIFLIPKAYWKQTITEMFSSMFYFQNWQLANDSVDYLAQNNEASPFQHFWALSVQGQFYITWPIIITVVSLLAKKVLKKPLRKTLLAVLIIIFTASISYSIYITAVNQPWAYFDTFARAWEFSLGGILALVLPYISLHKMINLILGWLGLAIISFTGILLPVSSIFPGYAALLPTSGVILVIIASENSSRFGVLNLLGSKLFQYLGSISYGFYLWHWPLLIFYFAYFKTDKVTFFAGTMILLISFVLSIVSIKYIEKPIREIDIKKSKKRLVKVIVALITPIILVGASWSVYIQLSLNGEYTAEENPGARAISHNITAVPGAELKPTMLQAKEQLPEFYSNGCYTGGDSAAVTKCSFGVTENPAYTIALVGGSHSGHWFPALMAMSEELGLQIDVYNKDACRFSADDFEGKLTEECMEWNKNVMEPLMENPPDLIFMTANNNSGDKVPKGYIDKWKEFEGITTVFAVRDNPQMKEDPTVCVEEKSVEKCSVPREEVLSKAVPWENTEGLPSNVIFADMSDYFCVDNTCPPVIGNVLVFRDTHHITTLYSETLTPALKEHIVEALKGL